MKAQAAADRLGAPRFVAHQVYYSLIGRAYEADLMPLAADQGVGALVWSPLGWGRLTGKIGRHRPVPAGSRLHETEQLAPDRKSGVEGKSVPVRVDLGGRRCLKQKTPYK